MRLTRFERQQLRYAGILAGWIEPKEPNEKRKLTSIMDSAYAAMGRKWLVAHPRGLPKRRS